MKKLSILFLGLVCMIGFVLTGCGSSSQSASGTSSADSKSSSSSLGKEVNYTITGIDAGAGEMKMAQDAIDQYGLSNWTLQSGSDATMTAALTKAIKEKKPIIITGWSPHWMFAKYKLKYLKDPKGVFGKSEEIHTVVTKGFVSEHPNAAKILKQFNWTPDQMGSVMLDISNGTDPAKAAEKWVKANPDVVKKWTAGATKGSGTIKLAYVAWDSAIASNNVVKTVLEDEGYKVELQQLQAGAMWAAVAKGSADAMLCAWLPTTHASYMKQFKNQVTDLATNLKGTKLGLVVPDYVNIDSIEDLKTN
ncbi:glycine betaine ABC transporter substrate-binding protein [Pullulanibacillus sp. KACC 23026]|uniref:glycine betaine ABC transporter substrate-binding protein n=1 Tax=Pullulanibacillus sp. KACC 23026 TaxID=3028315 RepID=UPI0023AF03BE|nr:glycine betaine ABC transporter substrate-binding protein [Pullulanibacillus sp. KACC 23026]WEG12061.1 glycine betaine ABC transporter substrate-binding protein [Pullulanibacillus sp. KACC 23026]